MLTFSDLYEDVLLYRDQAGDTDNGLDLAKSAINKAHQRRIASQRWSFMLWPTTQSLTFVAGQRAYVLHPEVQFLTDFQNVTADQRMVETPTRSRFKNGGTFDRYHFEFVGNSPVKAQPLTTGTVTVTGSLSIRYIDANGDVATESVTNAVSTGSMAFILDATKLTDDPATLVDHSGVTILTLSATEYGKQYPQIRLFQDGVSESGTYRFYRNPKVLSLDNAIPDIPFPYSNILVFDALLDLATYDGDNPNQFWVAQQGYWDMQLNAAFQEGEMEGSESRQIQDVDTYGG